MSRFSRISALAAMSVVVLAGCGQGPPAQAVQAGADEVQARLAHDLSYVARHRASEHQLDRIAQLGGQAVVVAMSKGSRTVEVAQTATASNAALLFPEDSAYIGCFRLVATWEQVSMQPIDCTPELVGGTAGEVLPPTELSSAPDVTVSHRPCYGGEPPDDPDCPGG